MTRLTLAALAVVVQMAFHPSVSSAKTDPSESDAIYLEEGDSLLVLTANGEPYFLPLPGMKRETIVIWRPRGLKAPEPIRIVPNVAPEPPLEPSR